MLPNGWKKVKLSELGTFAKGGGIKRDEANSGSIPAIRYGEIYTTHNDYIKEFHSFISEKVAKEATLLKMGDLLFSCSGETKEDIGKCVAFISDETAYAGGDIIILTPTVPCDSKYIGYLCNASFVNRQRYRCAQGDSIVHISAESIGKIEIPFPPLNEQKQIAEILSVCDKTIEKTEKLIELKLMQKKMFVKMLLDEKIYPHIFKLENIVIDKCKWEKRKLGDVCDTFSGGTPNRSHPEYFGGDVPWIKSGELNQGDVYRTEELLTKKGVENSSVKMVSKDTLLIAMYGATAGIMAITHIDAAINQAILALVPRQKIYNLFLKNVIEMQIDYAVRRLVQGGQPNFNASIIESFILPIPTLPEQQAVSNFLSNVDKEISLLKQQLGNYKKQKQGLMQKLLTGQWRVE